MSKRKKKRGGGRSPYEGYETEVWGSSPIQIAAIEKEYRSMEEELSLIHISQSLKDTACKY